MDDQRPDREGGRIRFRKARIAWSVVCGLACLMLIALRTRSYDVRDEAQMKFGGDHRVIFQSLYGGLELIASRQPMPWRLGSSGFQSDSVHDTLPPTLYRVDKQTIHYNYRGVVFAFLSGQYIVLGASHWFAILAVTALGATSWLPWRFRLRTLLIATTLLAIALGILVYMSK
jgi:hypothetical protein